MKTLIAAIALTLAACSAQLDSRQVTKIIKTCKDNKGVSSVEVKASYPKSVQVVCRDGMSSTF